LNQIHITSEDPLFQLLDQQLRGVNSSLLVCKWPVTLTSCLFVTLLCWDMAGDKAGWFQALWVVVVGVLMAIVIWICDCIFKYAAPDLSWFPSSLPVFFSFCSSLASTPLRHANSESIQTLEFVRPSFHQSSVPELGEVDSKEVF
jgi:hypothetical protein